MATKQTDVMREVRLWIVQIIIPATIAVVVIASNSNIMDNISYACNKTKNGIKNAFNKFI